MIVSHLALFPMPNVDDIEGHLSRQDVISVSGGSTVNLLALWRVHGLDTVLHAAWQAGTVLMGVSAGSLGWHDRLVRPPAATRDRRSRLASVLQQPSP
jgi:peptidase E